MWLLTFCCFFLYVLLVVALVVQLWIIRMVPAKLNRSGKRLTVAVDQSSDTVGANTIWIRTATRRHTRLCLAERAYQLVCEAVDLLLDLFFAVYLVSHDIFTYVLTGSKLDSSVDGVLQTLCDMTYRTKD